MIDSAMDRLFFVVFRWKPQIFFFNCDSICEVNVSELIYNRKCISIKLKFLLFPQKNL